MTTTAFIQGEVIRKKGVEYFRVKSFKWKIEPGEARSLFTNLFNGDKTLGISLYSGSVATKKGWKTSFVIIVFAYALLLVTTYYRLSHDLTSS